MRETLSRQVAVARPLGVDPAGQAIRRANRIRRRRTAAGLALAGVVTVLLSAGMAQLGAETGRDGAPIVVIGDPDPSIRPIPTASVPGIEPSPGTPAAQLTSETLVSADGRRLVLSDVGPAERAQLLPDGDGWLVVSTPSTAGRSLWVVQNDGLVQVLLAGAGPIVLAPDSRQVAWRDGSDLLVAGVVGTQLIGAARTPAPADAEPVRFVGDSVLVRPDPATAGHTLWQPAAGQAMTKAVDRQSLNVYGRLPDGRLVGQIATTGPDKTCLAVLDPTHLSPTQTGCGPDLSQDGVGGISADGRWLLVNGRLGKANRALLVDLWLLGPSTTAVSAGPPMTGSVVWSDESHASYLDGAANLVRVDVGRVRAGKPASPAPVPGVPAGDRPVLVTGF
ncbi:hypothetical protein [Micromonospora parathelypteridis]|uniref:Uncharacterized protein n=1 Tax=Micromonospora parathelypteridis TaxID=1839617 RepID=A0A840VQJ1_9ACTN|nr:hypothetical protein [Micromonospora parathelypteridis]MBB5478957.1 hypothetical protein [Micromonospora parathelypteridis]GGO03734.1 hypothetical protein GCM10011576_04460 [Micromonospora parathelypteridis]